MPDISGQITGSSVLTADPTQFDVVQAPPAPSGFVTGGYPVGTAIAGSTTLTPAIQTIWSKEILFQAMPILRFEQFAVKKTELGVMPGLTVNFMKYNNLEVDEDNGATLTEGIRMTTAALSAFQYRISVAEKGKAIALSELLLHASFDDVMASAARLLGRHMAQSMDYEARNTLIATAGNTTLGYEGGSGIDSSVVNNYFPGNRAANIAAVEAATTEPFYLVPHTVKDGVEQLASLNIPRLGETYVSFIHPHQSRRLRDTPEFIEVTKYAAPGNFMLGEIGRLNDVVFVETTQVKNVAGAGSNRVYTSLMIGDNAFGHAISLPVELRDGGVLDFGREHALAWYAIWGFGAITPQAVVQQVTN